MTNKGTARVDAFVDLDYFDIVHTDTATYDDLPDDPDNMPKDGEPANHLHLAQTHEIVVRIAEQLNFIRGEQRHFRKRCAPPRLVRSARNAHCASYVHCSMKCGPVDIGVRMHTSPVAVGQCAKRVGAHGYQMVRHARPSRARRTIPY